MSFNIHKKGKPICIIKGGEYDNTKIFLSDDIPNKDAKVKKNFENLKIDDGLIQQIPDTKKEREVGMVCGQSGSGKSHYIKNYCKEYKKAYKNDISKLFNKKNK